MPSLNQIRQVTYRGVSEGMDKVAADLSAVDAAQAKVATGQVALAEAQTKVVATTNATVTVTEKQSATVLRAGASLDKLLKQVDDQYRAEQRLAAGRSILENSMRQGLLTQDEYDKSYDRLIKKYSSAPLPATGSFSARMGLRGDEIKNLGFQLNDVTTMLASGSSPFQVMATQGGQVYQILQGSEHGVIGAVKGLGAATLAFLGPVGLAAAGFAALGTGAYFYASAMRDTTKVIEDHATALASLKAAYDLAAKGQTSFGVETANVHKVMLRYNASELEEGYRLQAEDIRRNIAFAGTKAIAAAPPSGGMPWSQTSNVGGLINMPTSPAQTTGIYTAFRSAIDDYVHSVETGTPRVRAFREEIARIADAHADDGAIQRQAKALLDMSAAAEKSESALGKDRDALKGVVDAARDGTGTLVSFTEAMSKLGGGIPEYLAPGLSARTKFDDRLRQIDEERRRALQSSAGQPPEVLGEIDRRAELQRQAARDEASATQWRTILEGRLKAGMPAYAVDNLSEDFGKKLAEAFAAAQARGAALPVVNEGYRTFADQARLYAQLGGKVAARPGSSLHEKGEAADLGVGGLSASDQAILREELKRRGIVNTNGEPWHFAEQKTAFGEANSAAQRSFQQAEGWQKTILDFEKGTQAIRYQSEAVSKNAEALVREKAILDLTTEAKRAQIPITGALTSQIQAEAEKRVAAYKAQELAERQIKASDELRGASKSILGGFISDLEHGRTLAESFAGVVEKLRDKMTERLTDSIIDQFLGKQGTNIAGGSGLFSGIFSGLGHFFGLFAGGGDIGGSGWGIVGENGPEVVKGPANVTPFAKIPAATPVAATAASVAHVTIKLDGAITSDDVRRTVLAGVRAGIAQFSSADLPGRIGEIQLRGA